ncbi:hypothetical protein HK413_00250 [Mucilaginibacter sp. S1162]|uniref:Coproporphyrinogen III oxidase n=1 Tax=Mucilaginibacter humi TaxID=2732510 RepID=A0ABX1W1B0_9SPHI|nr:hypothetical protein [Mucilaginibacter humi]
MKNSFKIAAIALVMASFVACKGKSTTTTDSVKTDSVKTDTTVKVDTAKKDTTKKILLRKCSLC